eukprot:TRINITY_DN2923_c0_g2_i4.p1 TRINITY_DN2923_c0_g2~~TRINITY_DN2923_c0_g2_i4.p1  ORF type:complete len:250 (+),score=55.13 TRINITY_DN2923_c0_g2_i4:276-1025(+)
MVIDGYQNFWDMMDEIDNNTCVIEPEKPKRSDTHRRLVVAKHVSLQVHSCPRKPFSPRPTSSSNFWRFLPSSSLQPLLSAFSLGLFSRPSLSAFSRPLLSSPSLDPFFSFPLKYKKITVDPTCPRSIPECRFLGADSMIQPYKYKLNTNLSRWDYNSTLRNNFQQILEIQFPSRERSESLDLNSECAICYVYKFEDMIPDIVCDGRGCGKAFHGICLYRWLQNTSNRQSLLTIVGECPYCETKITVKKR